MGLSTGEVPSSPANRGFVDSVGLCVVPGGAPHGLCFARSHLWARFPSGMLSRLARLVCFVLRRALPFVPVTLEQFVSITRRTFGYIIEPVDVAARHTQ